MEWIKGLQRAIDYIEEHLNEEIDYEILAKIAYSSTFHFQRVFSLMCGITVGEYIRRRRLTKAGNDLLCDNRKIVDVALKYGYETPD